MNITAQVRVYPLGYQTLEPPIQHAIERLQAAGLITESGSMSTVIAGEVGAVFDALRDIFSELASQGQVLFVR